MTRTLVHAFRFLFSASVALALTACAANPANSVPVAADAQAAVAPQVIQNDAGEFFGSIQDSTFGNGNASASLAQHEHGVGGYLTATFGSNTITNAVVLQTQTGLTVTGGEVANTNSGVCTFSMSATYKEKTNVLAGTYKAVHGCSGESGSFSITKGCYYPRGGLDAVQSWNRNPAQPNHGLRQC
jgi:hypothetical protein